MSALKEQLTAAMKDAMRAKEKARLGVFRMALSAIKQIEVDERIVLFNTGSGYKYLEALNREKA